MRALEAKDKFYPVNIEGKTDYNLIPPGSVKLPFGLSAMVRVKDEAEFLVPALESIRPWCDEIAVFLQGEQTDGTDRIALEWMLSKSQSPCVLTLYRYPFDSLPNGPGHDEQPRGSVYERAYFYNWCQSKLRYSYAMKWDGDMIACDGLGWKVRNLMKEGAHIISFRGHELVGSEFDHVSIKPRTANEPRVWRITPETWFYSGYKCEYFTFEHRSGHVLPNPEYLHLKWCKRNGDSIRTDWPASWTKDKHFLRINRRATPGAKFFGPYPDVMQPLLERAQSMAKWRPMRAAPDNKLILLRGPSGYGQHKTFYIAAYCDPEYRPPVDGRRRWLDPTNTDIHDYGWEPDSWMELPE